jgi:hypothetical protein
MPSQTKLARLGHFPPASQAGRRAGPVFYVYRYDFSLMSRKRGLHHSVQADQPANTVFAQIRNIFDAAKSK